jgi:hypothetical protein
MIGPAPFAAMANARKERLARIADAAINKPAPVVIALEATDEPKPTPPTAVRVPWTDFPPTIDLIKGAVCREFGVSRLALESACRTADIVLPRQVGIYLARKLTARSMPDIGRRFGGRDHSTIIHAIRKISHRLCVDPELANRINTIKESIGA